MSTTTINIPEATEGSVQAGGHPMPEPRPRTVEVLLVDDDRAASYSLWSLLNWRPGIRVSATVDSPTDAFKAIGRLRPDICLVAAALGEHEGPSLCHAIKQLPQPPRVILYGERASDELEGTGMIAGVDGTVSRYRDADRLERMIKRIAGGDLGDQPTLAFDGIIELIDRVADRDRPIAAMLLEGVSPDDIAWTQGISASSFRARRREIVKRIERSADSPAVARVTRPALRDPRSDDQQAANGGWTLPGRPGVTLPVAPLACPDALADSPGSDPQPDDGSQQANVVAIA
jgi:DNA-binding NarL/FixJ family response regulator